MFIYVLVIFINILMYIHFKKKEKEAKMEKETLSTIHITSEQLANQILNQHDLHDVKVVSYKKNFYNWKKKKVHIEEDSYLKENLYAIAVTSHECGHAIQHQRMTLLSIFRILTLFIRNLSFLGLIFLLVLHIKGHQGLETTFLLCTIGISLYYWVCYFHEKEANQIAQNSLEAIPLKENEKKKIKKIQKDLMTSYGVNLVSSVTLVIIMIH